MRSDEDSALAQEVLRVESQRRNEWGLVDRRFQLRMRSFFPLCIPPLFEQLESAFAVSGMRRRGVTQVMYYLDFEHHGVPLAVGQALRVSHELQMHRSIADRGGRRVSHGAGVERLLWHSVNRIAGQRADARGGLGVSGESSEPLHEAGVGRAIHILTRPTAAPGERAVTEVPAELRGLQLHPWQGPLPTADTLAEPAAGATPAQKGFRHEYRDIWGVANTDNNQHVNVLDYVMGLENQITRHRAAACFVADPQIRRLRMLFRRPCFAGERYLLATELYISGEHNYFHGGYFPLDSQGRPSARAAVLAMAEGETVAGQ